GPAAIAKVRKYQPAAYMKICALLVPREMKLEHSGGVKAMSEEQIVDAIEALEHYLAARAAGEAAKGIEGSAGRAGLPAAHGTSPGGGAGANVKAHKTQAEPADDGGRYCDRAAGAQAEEARAVAC